MKIEIEATAKVRHGATDYIDMNSVYETLENPPNLRLHCEDVDEQDNELHEFLA